MNPNAAVASGRAAELGHKLRRKAVQVLAPLIAGRSVILTAGAARNRPLERAFREAGAQGVSSVALPANRAASIRQLLMVQEEQLRRPPGPLAAAFDAVDPARQAVIYAGSFTACDQVDGRRVLGSRSAAQFALESKDHQAAIIGPDDSTKRLVAIGTDERHRTVELLAEPLIRSGGAVLSGVPYDFPALGASHIYLARSASDVARLLPVLATDCRQVRLSRFNRGWPCTYYGFVGPSWSCQVGPFEALVFVDRRSGRIRAFGIAGPVQLDPAGGEGTRATVSRVASRLAATGYRGAFGVDGVVEGAEYVVHEVNPRVCAGMSLVNELAAHELSGMLIDLVLRERPHEASVAFSTDLPVFAVTLSQSPPALRIWDGSTAGLPPLTGAALSAAWLTSLRQALAGGTLQPLGEAE